MNEPFTAFDARPDRELGAALRRALQPGDTGAFTARVLARLAAARAPAWEVLAGWSRRGLVAAVVAAVIMGVVTGRALSRAAPLDDTVAATAETEGGFYPAALLAAGQPPEPGALFASLVE